MRSVQVSKPNGPFEIVERAILEPGAGSVRIKVQACGICHSDVVSVSRLLGSPFPLVPGHGVVVFIDALGAAVKGWSGGQRGAVVSRRAAVLSGGDLAGPPPRCGAAGSECLGRGRGASPRGGLGSDAEEGGVPPRPSRGRDVQVPSTPRA